MTFAENPRYIVQARRSFRRDGATRFVIFDDHRGEDGKLYNTEAEAQGAADQLNGIVREPARVADPEPPANWSKAGRRRAGQLAANTGSPAYGRGIHHPGDGFTTYETHDGSGDFSVQIWDRS
jgi:hypothetical protein